MRRRNQDTEKEKRIRSFDKLLALLQIFFIGFAFLLAIYLFFIQIVDLGKYRVKAINQRVSRNFVLRGDIFDRNGIKLATDKIYMDIYAHPNNYDSTPEELSKKLSPILDIPYNKLLTILKKPGPVITIKKDIDKATAKEVSKLQLREISMGKKSTRTYPQGNLAAHILGYYNFDADIANGVEYTAKDKLEHVEHAVRYQRTRDGKIIYDFLTDPVATTINPKGEDVTLTIDAAIQHVCEKELQKMIKEKEALRGTAIVMNPKNGEILAYAVYPTYDPNNFKKASALQMKNWSLTDVFPPGSTFKPITVASAMELGKINEHTKVLDTGKTTIGKWQIKNYDYDKNPNPGMISLEYLFEHSSNIGSINVAKTMTSKEFYDMLKKFGFGQKSGIDLPGESAGLLPAWHKWDKGIHATMSYGYGTSVSAMQMVSAMSALANNGVRVTPHIIKYSPQEAEQKIQSVQVVSPETAQAVTKLLAESVNNGKSAIKMAKYNVAAKTGTSNKPKEGGSGYTGFSYTSTIGYLPASDPQILIYVCVDSAKVGPVWGNTVAGPVFYEIAEQTARILNLKQDKTTPTKKSKE
ncbi:MAG: penicillin-binding protein 2 [Cyanobacteria bacterium SIG32]|nr:penicillin-binding protein 2 [Cyanobacteria bacterium SIG32]